MKNFKIKSYTKSTYAYTKLRKSFGRQPLFQIVPAHIIDSINPNAELQNEYMLRNPVHREVQATLPQSEHDTNTKQIFIHEQGINHTEGGWPRDVHLYNEDHLNRHRRRVQHDDNYVHSILKMRPHIDHCIAQNNAIDMYETYFADMQLQTPVEKYHIQIANTFRDPFCRPISCIVWTNEKKAKLVASYCHKRYPESENYQKNVCYVWDVNKQTSPLFEFFPSHGCWQVACLPSESELLITGLENGTVSVFDIRVSSNSVGSSSIYNSHFAPVSALLYTHSRTNTEFFTGSPDGQCLWWDKRNISKPIDRLKMAVKLATNEEPSFINSEGVSSLEFDRGLPTKFLCGTESGLIINANRMGRSHSEILTSYWEAHTGPVRAVQRSPCTLRMFISCGDWRVRIWSEEVRTAPIIVTSPYRYQVTDVCWAPMRYSSYMAVSEDGVFYYWDLIRKFNKPVTKLHISRHGLNKLNPHPGGQSIAVGDYKGSLFLLHLSENMTIPGTNDKQLVHQIYNRETKREHNVDTRLKEIRLKARADVETPTILNEEDEISDVEDLEKLTEQYLNIVKEEMGQMGGVLANNLSYSNLSNIN
ncbi:dynein intermediate chain 3, ciliary-like [Pararge aegeria]|uniref:dynein intermediate chain 3, ciliary-like n=1 Tax=Pararge aegeria TaxID=116150 RepID=UPI0019D184A4|nr:dynein intermediate chain 3, ciliary-like [Pararge aegeria]